MNHYYHSVYGLPGKGKKLWPQGPKRSRADPIGV